MESLAQVKGLIWNGSAWAAPPEEVEIDDDGLALQAAILDLSIRNKFLERYATQLEKGADNRCHKLLSNASTELIPRSKSQMQENLEIIADRLEEQRDDYETRKTEHEKVSKQLITLLQEAREEFEEYRLQTDQTAAMAKLYEFFMYLF